MHVWYNTRYDISIRFGKGIPLNWNDFYIDNDKVYHKGNGFLGWILLGWQAKMTPEELLVYTFSIIINEE